MNRHPAHRLILTACAGFVYLASAATPAQQINGPDVWRARAEQFRNPPSAELTKNYKVVRVSGDLYQRLYKNSEFEAVGVKLLDMLGRIGDPLHAYEYSMTIDYLATLNYSYEPDEVLATARTWTEKEPGSHVAWLIRGGIEFAFAWYWRSDGYASKVTEEGWENFRSYLKAATESLKRAYELNPRDPEISCMLFEVSHAAQLSVAETDAYFERVVALVPGHYNAYSVKLQYSRPQWGGSWQAVEQTLDEIMRVSAEQGNPLLPMLKWSSYLAMRDQRQGYADVFKRPEIAEELIRIFRAAFEKWPDQLKTRSDYTRIIYYFDDYAAAHEQFELMGDVYYVPSRWNSLENYNQCRAHAAFAVSLAEGDEQKKVELVLRAIELDPTNGRFHLEMAGFYLSQKNEAMAEAAFKDAVEADPEYEYGWYNLAMFYNRLGRNAELLETVEASRNFKIRPNFRNTMDMWAEGARKALQK